MCPIPLIEYREPVRVVEGPWHQLARVRNVLCPDGVYRSVRITGEPDTYFSQPATVCVGSNRRTVSGFITYDHFGKNVLPPGSDSLAELVGGMCNNAWELDVCLFHPYKYGRNADVFPDREVEVA